MLRVGVVDACAASHLAPVNHEDVDGNKDVMYALKNVST